MFFLITVLFLRLLPDVIPCTQINQTNESYKSFAEMNCKYLSSTNHTTLVVDNYDDELFEKFQRNLEKVNGITIVIKETFFETINFTRITTWNDSGIIIVGNFRLKNIFLSDLIFESSKDLIIRGNVLYTPDMKIKKKTKKFKRNIQPSNECYFLNEINSSEEYANCSRVYGNMEFSSTFEELEMKPTKLFLDGCLIIKNTRIKYVTPMNFIQAKCPTKHEFTGNPFMCADQLKRLNKVLKRIDTSNQHSLPVNCASGECYGGVVLEKWTKLYLGCETVKSNLEIGEESGNITRNIYDISFIRRIEGQFNLKNNEHIRVIKMPLLKNIRSLKCPALVISNMTNLEYIIFHHDIEVFCKQKEKPMIIIEGNPKLKLHLRLISRFQLVPNVMILRSREYDHLKYFSLSVVFCVAIFILMEIVIWFQSKEIFRRVVGNFPNNSRTGVTSSSSTTFKER